jgi:outer membrane protein TolC
MCQADRQHRFAIAPRPPTVGATWADADALAAAWEAEKAARLTLDLTQRQMQAGYVGYLTLLSAQTAYSQAVLGRVHAQATRTARPYAANSAAAPTRDSSD